MNEVYYKNKNAVAILRVSSKKQKDGISHDVQELKTKEYCNREGLNLVKTFILVESAKKAGDRTQYREAMAFIKKHQYGNVLFYMIDREARNYTDLEENENKVSRGELTIHYVSDGKILHRDSPESDFMVRDMGGMMSRQFIRTLQRKVIDAMDTKAEMGWYPSNHPPLGYVCSKVVDEESGKIKSRNGIIALDPKEENRRVVSREFELRVKGYSYEKIKSVILQEGLLTGKKAIQYSKSSIERRINNPFYRGQFEWRGKIYDGKHELFIPKDWIRQIDSMESGRGISKKVLAEEDAITGGWLKCSCGCFVVHDPKKKLIKKNR